MDRVILGKAPANSSPYYHRDGKQGLFVSKKNANVYSCSDGDLLFDTTAPGIVQILEQGRVTVPPVKRELGIFGEQGRSLTTILANKKDHERPIFLNRKTCWNFHLDSGSYDMALFADSPLGPLSQPITSNDNLPRQFSKFVFLVYEMFHFLKWDQNNSFDPPGTDPPSYGPPVGTFRNFPWVVTTQPNQNQYTNIMNGTLNPTLDDSWTTEWNTFCDISPLIFWRIYYEDVYNLNINTEIPQFWKAVPQSWAPHLLADLAFENYQKNTYWAMLNLAYQYTQSVNETIVANRTNNWGESFWSGGKVTASVAKAPPSPNPVMVWWNPISVGSTGKTITNLSFLGAGDHIVKDASTGSIQRPGYNLQANTYIEDDVIKVDFLQSSTVSSPEIHYTIFREKGFPDGTDHVGHISLDTSDISLGGDNRAGRLNSDGRHYTVTFPDDFVGTKFDGETDPFKGYRNESGLIDGGLSIFLTIPASMELSGNGVTFGSSGFIGTSEVSGTSQYGPLDSANRIALEDDARINPCVKLNLSTTEWTESAFDNLHITIENYGKTVGGGGYGQVGIARANTIVGKAGIGAATDPGGGGGGGAGLHPVPPSNHLWTQNPDTYIRSLITALPGAGGEGYSGVTDSGVGLALLPNDGSYSPGYGGNPTPSVTQGEPGEHGTLTGGGVGGADFMLEMPGYFHLQSNTYFGTPRTSHGGTCVYLFCNSTSSHTGTKISVINRSSGIFCSGGGGGSGGDAVEGKDGGDLGEPGENIEGGESWYVVEEKGYGDGRTRRGEPGRLVWWNTSNLAVNYTIANESTTNLIRGMDLEDQSGTDEGYYTFDTSGRTELPSET